MTRYNIKEFEPIKVSRTGIPLLQYGEWWVSFTCPSCRKRIRSKLSAGGSSSTCYFCKRSLVIPSDEEIRRYRATKQLAERQRSRCRPTLSKKFFGILHRLFTSPEPPRSPPRKSDESSRRQDDTRRDRPKTPVGKRCRHCFKFFVASPDSQSNYCSKICHSEAERVNSHSYPPSRAPTPHPPCKPKPATSPVSGTPASGASVAAKKHKSSARKPRSVVEGLLRNFLAESDLLFKLEWRHAELKGEHRPLRCDVAVGVSDSNELPLLIIELNGAQHYAPFGMEVVYQDDPEDVQQRAAVNNEQAVSDFRRQQKYDRRKRSFAKKNGIAFAEIPNDLVLVHFDERTELNNPFNQKLLNHVLSHVLKHHGFSSSKLDRFQIGRFPIPRTRGIKWYWTEEQWEELVNLSDRVSSGICAY